MTDTPNIGLKKYGVADPANLLSGYNSSMDTLDTVIKNAQDDIDSLEDSVASRVKQEPSMGAELLNSEQATTAFIFQLLCGNRNSTLYGHTLILAVDVNGLRLLDKDNGYAVLWRLTST